MTILWLSCRELSPDLLWEIKGRGHARSGWSFGLAATDSPDWENQSINELISVQQCF